MEDKIFDLIEKMYADLKNDIGIVNNKVTNLESEVKNIGNQIIKRIT